MRSLKFIVDGTTIRLDSACSLSGLYPGSEDHVQAEFTFSPEWKSRVKVAAFWSMMGTEYQPQELKDGKSCMIPVEALKRASFKVQVLGKQKGAITSTNKTTVEQNGGNS